MYIYIYIFTYVYTSKVRHAFLPLAGMVESISAESKKRCFLWDFHSWGVPKSWGYPNSWMVYFMEKAIEMDDN